MPRLVCYYPMDHGPCGRPPAGVHPDLGICLCDEHWTRYPSVGEIRQELSRANRLRSNGTGAFAPVEKKRPAPEPEKKERPATPPAVAYMPAPYGRREMLGDLVLMVAGVALGLVIGMQFASPWG